MVWAIFSRSEGLGPGALSQPVARTFTHLSSLMARSQVLVIAQNNMHHSSQMHFYVLGSRDQMPFSIRSSLSVYGLCSFILSPLISFSCAPFILFLSLYISWSVFHILSFFRYVCSCPVLPLQLQAFASATLPIFSSMGRELILPIRNEPAAPAPGTFAYRRLRRFQFWSFWRHIRIAILAQGVWQDHHLRSFCDAALARVQDSLLDADHFCVLLDRCVR